MNKYLNKEEIEEIIGKVVADPDFLFMSQDSYNETQIAHVIAKTGKAKELLEATLNISVIGAGNNRLGSYRIGPQVIDIGALLVSAGVRLKVPPASNLREDELTVQRLCRFYRYQIKEHLEKTGYQTYLWRKYSHRIPQFNTILFRGCEYLNDLSDEQEAEIHYAFEQMDKRLHTTFVERLGRIRSAQKGDRLLK